MKENSMSYRTAKQETERLICEIEEMTITHRAYTAECLRRVLKENEEFRNFLEKIIREYIPDYELEQLIDRYKNESFIPRVEVKKILEDRRK